jgi:hypothetical protein
VTRVSLEKLLSKKLPKVKLKRFHIQSATLSLLESSMGRKVVQLQHLSNYEDTGVDAHNDLKLLWLAVGIAEDVWKCTYLDKHLLSFVKPANHIGTFHRIMRNPHIWAELLPIWKPRLTTSEIEIVSTIVEALLREAKKQIDFMTDNGIFFEIQANSIGLCLRKPSRLMYTSTSEEAAQTIFPEWWIAREHRVSVNQLDELESHPLLDRRWSYQSGVVLIGFGPIQCINHGCRAHSLCSIAPEDDGRLYNWKLEVFDSSTVFDSSRALLFNYYDEDKGFPCLECGLWSSRTSQPRLIEANLRCIERICQNSALMEPELQLDEKALLFWMQISVPVERKVDFSSDLVEQRRQELRALCPYLLKSHDMWNLDLEWTRTTWANFSALLLTVHLERLNGWRLAREDDERISMYKWNFIERVRKRIARHVNNGQEKREISTRFKDQVSLIVIALNIILAIDNRL